MQISLEVKFNSLLKGIRIKAGGSWQFCPTSNAGSMCQAGVQRSQDCIELCSHLQNGK